MNLKTKKDLLESIEHLIDRDLVERMLAQFGDVIEMIDEWYCICGHHRNMHSNGDGGSPSICEEECKCNDYQFNFIVTLFVYYQNTPHYALPTEISQLWHIFRSYNVLEIVKRYMENKNDDPRMEILKELYKSDDNIHQIVENALKDIQEERKTK